MIALLVYEEGIVLYNEGEFFPLALPSGWITPTHVDSRVLEGAIRKLRKGLGPPRAEIQVLLFTEFVHYLGEIKKHMQPSKEEIRSLVKGEMALLYPDVKEEDLLVLSIPAVDGTYAMAVSKKVLGGLSRVLRKRARFLSASLFLSLALREARPGEGRIAALLLEMGMAMGFSLYVGDVYRILRFAEMGKVVEPHRGITPGEKEHLQNLIGEELSLLIPPGVKQPHFLALSPAVEALFSALEFSLPIHRVSLEELLLGAPREVYRTATYSYEVPQLEPGRVLRKTLPYFLLGGALVGEVLWGLRLAAEEALLKVEIERREVELQRVRLLQEGVPRLEESRRKYLEALGFLRSILPPDRFLEALEEAYLRTGGALRYRSLTVLPDGRVELLGFVPLGEAKRVADLPLFIERSFREAGYEAPQTVRFQYSQRGVEVQIQALLKGGKSQ